MIVDRSSSEIQQPSACFSCHAIGISSSSALGAYMFYQAKKAQTSTHRFTCALFGLGFFIFASHRVSSLFKDISQQRIAANGRMKRSFEERR
ncbi:unnamed protein product [Adineta steineri]|uniref:Uncharacterized protein n=1 Tax=Adineta steineri TaxID=433720 RepID=A0A813PQZ1_9BILA|nr:unnamed protein product [Adineta steineri]CAF0783777.1 unnamed protein product [Adineta steineri]CAF0802366.1 unnamed protein product [Adineta steineri]CAF0813786.1 unnamed protein product [Adineta steineri]CAF0851616.1 unnamed protein product [Adineta steineri]